MRIINALLAIALITALAPLAATNARADERGAIVVNWNGTGDYTTIQEALDAASDGATIVVMPSTGSPQGAYVEALTFPALNITLESSNPTDPGVVSSTVISGGGTDRPVTFDIGAPSGAILSGFTITQGYANQGGGIRLANGSPTIRNCTVLNCVAENGGGIYVWNGSPEITDCNIMLNSATYQGGGMVIMGYGQPETTELTDCFVMNNIVSGEWSYGGGIYIDDIGATISGGQIANNTVEGISSTGGEGGGLYCRLATVEIDNCAISGNDVEGTQAYGGGISSMESSLTLDECSLYYNFVDAIDYAGGGGVAAMFSGSVTITGGSVSNNSTTGSPTGAYSGGGGVYAFLVDLSIEDCTIAGNVTPSSGGGVFAQENITSIHRSNISANSGISGGGVFLWDGSLEIHNSLVTWNEGEQEGAGINSWNSPVYVYTSTIAHNITGEMGFGGGLSVLGAPLEIHNSILWGNEAIGGPQLAINYWEANDFTIADLYYTDIQGGEDEVNIGAGCTLNLVEGIIDLDPKFADIDGPDDNPDTYANNDFHLMASSPCVNNGDPAYIPTGGPMDLDGQLREVFCRVDMGAYESSLMMDCNGNSIHDVCDIHNGIGADCNGNFQLDACEESLGGDYNGDNVIDLDDFAALHDCLAGPNANPTPSDPQCAGLCLAAFDSDEDGDVDLEDALALIEAFD